MCIICFPIPSFDLTSIFKIRFPLQIAWILPQGMRTTSLHALILMYMTKYVICTKKSWHNYFYLCQSSLSEPLKRKCRPNAFVRFLWKLVIPGLIGRINEAETLTLRQNGLTRNTLEQKKHIKTQYRIKQKAKKESLKKVFFKIYHNLSRKVCLAEVITLNWYYLQLIR